MTTSLAPSQAERVSGAAEAASAALQSTTSTDNMNGRSRVDAASTEPPQTAITGSSHLCRRCALCRLQGGHDCTRSRESDWAGENKESHRSLHVYGDMGYRTQVLL
eukprot:2435232-Rhodomonas_salina.2